jgi:hypothetical protein
MSDQAQLLAKMSAELEKASSDFSAKAEAALGEAKKAGVLSAETKAVVDEMALKFNTLTEAEKTLKAQLGELEQEFARIPTQAAAGLRETLGGTVIKSEALAEFAKSIQGNRRVSVPVNAALLSTGVAEGVVEPQRLPGIDVMPKQRLFIDHYRAHVQGLEADPGRLFPASIDHRRRDALRTQVRRRIRDPVR